MSNETKTDVKIQNLTAKRLTIRGNDSRILILSPFEKEKALSAAEQDFFPRLDRLKMQNLISTWTEEKAGDLESQIKILFWAGVVGTGVASYVAYQVMTDSGKVAANPEAVSWLKLGTPVLFVLVMLIGSLVLLVLRKGEQKKAFFRNVARWILQAFSLLIIVTIGMVLPTLAFYQFGGGRELLGGPNSLAKLGRTLQLVFIFAASLLPALLYYLFDRQQLGTLRQRFEQQIFRLDPNIESLCDVRAKYGRQIDEIYGRETVSGEGRLTRGTRWPILVATLVITIGWMLTLLPAGPAGEMSSPNQLIDFFMPQRSVVTFGFLGAYFFVLNTVLHRYVRADLKPKAYSSITVRILIVIILAWVIGLPFSSTNSYELALVFMVGVFPESGLTLIRESIRNQRGFGKLAGVFGKRKEKYPLTDLEELDVYDRARLLDEGVTNIESLAHHDLIDLMLETRIPVPRLVDWLDQAVLYLHLAPDNDDGRSAAKTPFVAEFAEKPKDAAVATQKSPNPHEQDLKDIEPVPLHEWLRRNSVRTATDFIGAYNSKDKPLRRKAETEGRTEELDVLLETLEDDEWLDYIDHWRKSSRVQGQLLDASSSGSEPTRVNVRIKSLAGQQETYEADFIIDEANPDSMAPAAELEKIGIQPVGKTAYRLSDGAVREYPFALAEISFMGETTAGRVVFGPEGIQPVLGITALQSVGVRVNPTSPSLRRMPGNAN